MLGSLSLVIGSCWSGFSLGLHYLASIVAKTILALVSTWGLWTWPVTPIADPSVWRWSQKPEWIFLDAGEFPQALLRAKGEMWLINVGNFKNYKKTLKPLLQFYGVSKIDGVLITHISETSNGGLRSLLNEYQIREIIRPESQTRSPLERDWEKLMQSKSTPVQKWKEGEYRIAGLSAKVLNSTHYQSTSSEDLGLVILFSDEKRELIWGNRISENLEKSLLGSIETTPFVNRILVQGMHPHEENFSREWLIQVRADQVMVPDFPMKLQRTGYRHFSKLETKTSAKITYLHREGMRVLQWE